MRGVGPAEPLASQAAAAMVLMTRKAYPSALSDVEWDDVKDLLPPASKIGSPRTVELREIIYAIFYLVDNGIKWRAMRHDLPP